MIKFPKLKNHSDLGGKIIRILRNGGNLVWTTCPTCKTDKNLDWDEDLGMTCRVCGYPKNEDYKTIG